MRKWIITISIVLLIGVGYGIISTQAGNHEDLIERFYKSDVTTSERAAYELHVIVDSMLCDCEDELGYVLPSGEGITLAVQRRLALLDATEEEKEQLIELAEEYSSRPQNIFKRLERQLQSLEKQYENAEDEDREDIEEEIATLKPRYEQNKEILKEEIKKIHSLVEKIDERTNGSYYKDEHSRKGIN
ncbi:hypothetical protein ACTWQB_12110 [Piscibacillus sp. B03]|uniref:hypothetical protein n=1 Tax=Piscibacillus sp. B03 TaxID=3457430 RepID=UPI003FCE5451